MKLLRLLSLAAIAAAAEVSARTDGDQYILKEDGRSDDVVNNSHLFGSNVRANKTHTQVGTVPPLSLSEPNVKNGQYDPLLDSAQHGLSSMSIYEILTTSADTQKIGALIAQSASLISALNSTSMNHTIFVPTDSAFSKLPNLKTLPWDEMLEIIKYHITPHSFPLLRIISTPTIPTLLEPSTLNGQQRLKFGVDAKSIALTVNSYSHVTSLNIQASNGYIHKVDSVIFPPKSVLEVIESLPVENYSLFQLAMIKTGMSERMRRENFVGSTIFVPTNSAFALLGRRLVSFLFSESGETHLSKLLQYHIMVNETLYSNAFYKTSAEDIQRELWDGVDEESWDGSFPKGYREFDLQTLLGWRRLKVEIVRYSGAIAMLVDRLTPVTEMDWLAKDGVIHSIDRVLSPPKN